MDVNSAVQYLFKAYKHGHLVALYEIARLHQRGILADSSCSTAVQLFKNVAEKGTFMVKPTLKDAHSAYSTDNLHGAAMGYLISSEVGSEIAQSNLAYLLEYKSVMFVDDRRRSLEAFVQWHRAANQGNIDARIRVGDYFYYGSSISPNHQKAINYYQVAASENSAMAMFNLGFMYENGIGLQRVWKRNQSMP
jgi:SEL1 protein